MKRILSILGLLAGYFSGAVCAAELSLPGSVALLAVDGQKVEHTQMIQLPGGTHQFVFRYEESLRYGSRKKKYQSTPLVVFIPFSESASMVLSHSRFRDYSTAESAFENGTVVWQLVDSQGKYTALQPVELPGNPGFLPYQNIEAAIARYNRQQGISRLSGGTSSPRTELSPSMSKSPQSTETGQTEIAQPSGSRSADHFVPQIQAWYLQATDAQRKALLKWMMEQQ
ncbi:DUF2057 family protein [Vibrio rhizosphaerae]|uniref:DUF2057 family protein n=1 Tax=Vibrio rhizosphaerae TaxID=398736 RepID=A0ABU4IRE8_9VIBR|nr:DUF2057 family protein [Vibrio rhizosphaerae]MDW6091974.1 DUF2057 family protein [Vibrio rhizosphaerae]